MYWSCYKKKFNKEYPDMKVATKQYCVTEFRHAEIYTVQTREVNP